MNWNLSESLGKFVDYFKPESESEERAPSPPVNEDTHNIGIQNVDCSSSNPVPFCQIESTFHSYVEVVLPLGLNWLQLHEINVKKWRKLKDSSKLRSEYERSVTTVNQIKTVILKVEKLRSKVNESDHPVFDKRFSPVKKQSLVAVDKFVMMCNECDDGLSQTRHKDGSLLPASTGKEDLIPVELKKWSKSTNTGNPGSEFTHIERNGLSTDAADAKQSFLRPDSPNDLSVQSFGSENESSGESVKQKQLELVLEKENPEIDESWKKNEKDMTESHETKKDEQGETVDSIANRGEEAEGNTEQGKAQFQKATTLGAAMFPVLGAVVGGAIGGPIGAVAGFKLGSVTTGLAAAGITGTVLGYQGGKALKETQEDKVEMEEIKE